MNRFGPWQLVKRLGAGATAEVFLAHGPNPRGAELLALKLVLPHLAQDGGHRALLIREAKAVSALRHPNVVEVYEVGEVDGRPYLAMEYVPGFPLNALIRAARDKGERLSVAEAAHLVREAALGLHHAHEALDPDGQPLGLIHRDVSPHNLMLSGDGAVKVVDFGLARATHASATQTGGLKGKLRYMPPEQLRSEPLDRRVDVFALGAILWELCLGTPLYPGPTEADIFQQALFAPQPHPDEVARGLPRALVEVLVQAVARDPAKRPQTAADLAALVFPFVTVQARAEVSQRMARLLGRAPRSGAEASAFVVPLDLTRAQTGSVPTVSESLAPPEVGARPPAPPPAPIHTPQEARRAPPLASMPKVSRVKPTAPNKARRRAPGPADTQPAPAHEGRLVRRITSTLVRRWRRKEYVRWGAVAAVAALTGAGLVGLLRSSPEPAPEASAAPIGIPAEASARVDSPVTPEEPAMPAAEAPKVDRERPSPPPRRRRGKGTLILTSSAPAVVQVGGREYGMTPLTVELPSGTHKVKLRTLDGAAASSFEVTLPRDGVVKRQVALEPL